MPMYVQIGTQGIYYYELKFIRVLRDDRRTAGY